MSRTAQPGLTVASRIMQILTTFSPDRPELGPSEVARRSGLPYATAHRLLTELVRTGALTQSSSGGYSIGLRLWEIGSLTALVPSIREVAVPYMHRLRAVQVPHVQLNVPCGTEGLRVERLCGCHRGSPGAFVRFPLHATSGGLTLLASADPDLRATVLAGPLRRLTPRTVSTGEQLRRLLAEVRAAGAATCAGQYEPGRADVAAPILDPAGTAVASLEVVTGVQDDVRRHLAAVRGAAAAVSSALGAAATPPGPSTRDGVGAVPTARGEGRRRG